MSENKVHWNVHPCGYARPRRPSALAAATLSAVIKRTADPTRVTCKLCIRNIRNRAMTHHAQRNARYTACGLDTNATSAPIKRSKKKDRVDCPGCMAKMGMVGKPDVGRLLRASKSFSLAHDKDGWYFGIRLYGPGDKMQVAGDDIMERWGDMLLEERESK